MLRYFKVFNADQADGLGAKFAGTPDERTEVERLEAAEAVMAGYLSNGPSIAYGRRQGLLQPHQGPRTAPGASGVPLIRWLLLHRVDEFTHSTGHQSRLNRESVTTGHAFGDETYSKEELVAEMGAAMLVRSLAFLRTRWWATQPPTSTHG